MMDDVLWQPEEQQIESSKLAHYCHYLREESIGDFRDYDALWHWSVTDMNGFWSSVWDFADIIGDKGAVAYLHDDNIRNARFFPDAAVNYAENMLRYKGSDDAIIFHSEDGQKTIWSFDRLSDEVSVIQQAMRASDIGKGDRVAAIVPNTAYSIAFMLAAASVGAIWSSCSPDFGFAAAMDRLAQIEPKLLICADGYHYNGKSFASLPLGAELLEAIPSLQQLVYYPLLGGTAPAHKATKPVLSYDEFTSGYHPAEIDFERVSFDHPLYIMFSSGTTGLPKCIVHSVGGTMMKHKQELLHHGDVHEGDRLFYFTTCGWMMWNWSVSALMCGATLVLYDGSPFYPDAARFAAIIEEEQVTHFGTSAKYIDACAKAGLVPSQAYNLDHLRVIFSTGSPLSAQGFDYIYSAWKADLCLASIAGGTDIIGCFVGGSAISPVYRGQCQKRLLGMNVQVFNDKGEAVQGEKGELVCISAHPSMPVSFWNDTDGSRYHKAYFARFDNIWHHGDCVELTEQGGMVFYGRSDATLNPGGVRIGTAEIYRQVEALDEVVEAVVVGQEWDNDQRVVLFVKLRDTIELDADLCDLIKKQIRKNATPRHVPAIILQVPDIPRTKSGKITELAVRDIIHGKEIDNVGALANPEALEYFRDLPELSA